MFSQFSSFICAAILFLSLIAANAQSAQPQQVLRPIQQNGKWGYINAQGKIVVAPQFVWAEEFSEGLAAFETDEGKYGYIDAAGKIVIAPRFERWSPFSEGLAAVSPKLFEWGFIDQTGNWVIEPRFAHAFDFKDGLAPVSLRPPDGEPFTPGLEKRAFIDRTGRIVFELENKVSSAGTSAGLAFIHFFEPMGLPPDPVIADRTGKIVVEAEEIDSDGFFDGLTPVRKSKKWGYVDPTGKFVIEPQFDDAKQFSEKLAAVRIGKSWGYINTAGKLVIPARFEINSVEDEKHRFSEGLAFVYTDDRCAFINPTGKIAFKFDCADAGRFIGGLALVRLGSSGDEKRGYIDRTGKYVWKPTAFRYKTAEDVQAQLKKRREKAGESEADEEKLLPLTDAEKAANYRDMVADQPDFAADLSYFRSEEFSGGGFGYRLARKGARYRKESQFWIFVGETGKSRARLDPATKTYNDLEGVDFETASTADDFNPRTLVDDPSTVFTPLGKIKIDDHECVKIEAKRKLAGGGENEKIYLYAAKDLKNLIVAAQVLNPPRQMTQRLSNILLDVPEAAVSIPADYKPTARDVWTKVENARVKYNNKFSKDFGVFRSPTGELFVWVADAPYQWHYLIRPKQATVATAYQGMLVTRGGEFVWRTKEAEALSETYYRSPAAIEQDDAKPVRIKSPSLKFQSNNSDTVFIEVILPPDKPER